MLLLTEEITGQKILPCFLQNVIQNYELKSCLNSLHKMIMNGSQEFAKEEMLLIIISELIKQYGQLIEKDISEHRKEVEITCDYIKQHFSEHISLEQLCEYSKLSKSTLLRSFTKSKGVTPYRYLQSIRINEAKRLLENGESPINAALQTGFSDQSHFSNFFNMFIGLSPSAYKNIFNESKEARNEK